MWVSIWEQLWHRSVAGRESVWIEIENGKGRVCGLFERVGL